ncbi:hypothetical protein LNP25_18830 [Klebsiella variicola subsp. variicola]|nr:hypothetical protein [Klebsiella variicola subsp. variicola]
MTATIPRTTPVRAEKFPGGFVDKNALSQDTAPPRDHANPHHANPVAALGAFQIAGDQADNQRAASRPSRNIMKWDKHANALKCKHRQRMQKQVIFMMSDYHYNTQTQAKCLENDDYTSK